MAEQLRECLQAAGGGSYTNDEGEGTIRGALLGGRARASFGDNRTYCCRGNLPSRGGASLWAGRARRAPRTHDFSWPPAGLLCHYATIYLPYRDEWASLLERQRDPLARDGPFFRLSDWQQAN
jgi:hypothetical protein